MTDTIFWLDRRGGSEMTMLRLFTAGLTIAVALIGAHAAASAQTGRARAGRDFVVHNCDACHVVAANQDLRPLVANYGPSFFDVANRPDTTAASLQVFLSRPHGYSSMPYPDLSAKSLADVVAYILSLRGTR